MCLFLFTKLSFAQVPESFYNVTGIKTKKLANAVQITIQTDGDVSFGFDYADFYSVDRFNATTKPTSSIRVRLIGARTRLPTFNNIGAYPVDSAVITLGTEPMKFPNFSRGNYLNPDTPKLDIEVRTYVPVTVESLSTSAGEGFTSYLRPRQARVELTPDRKSIQITVITDRVETERLEKRLDRSPAEGRKHETSVTAQPDGKLTIHALHGPLSELLPKLSDASGVPLTLQPDALDVEVSLSLARVTLDEAIRALARGTGLGVSKSENNGYLIGRGGEVSVTEQIPLRFLDPRTARLLLPDFLLASIRADLEVNALVITHTPEIVRRVREDIARLDTPRTQVKITATAYELELTDDERASLAALYGSGDIKSALNAESAQLAVTLGPAERRRFTTQLDALLTKGRATLLSQPSLVVAAGATGTLFAGQQRFVNVTTNRFGIPQGEILQLPIGATLTVTPNIGAGGDVLLDIAPRFASVVSVEAGTRLPTLGIRESASRLRIRPGETVLVASLDLALSEKRQRTGLPQRRSARQNTSLLILVTATPVGTSTKP